MDEPPTILRPSSARPNILLVVRTLLVVALGIASQRALVDAAPWPRGAAAWAFLIPPALAAAALGLSALESLGRRARLRPVLRVVDLLALAGFVSLLQDRSSDFYLVCLYVLLIGAESPGLAWPLAAAAVAAGAQAVTSLLDQGAGALLTASFALRIAFIVFSALLLAVLAREAERERQARHAARRELSARIADLEEFLDNLLQSVQTGVLVVDPGGLVELCNRRAAEILGVRSEDLVDRPLRETAWIHPLAREMEAWRSGAPVRTEVALVRPSGSPIELGVGLSPLTDAAGRPLGAVVVFQDITPIKDYQRRMLQQERLAAAGQIAGGVAHEFGNLLGGLRSHAEFALQSGRAEELSEALRVVARNIDRALLITRNLLSFSRPSPPRAEPCHLARLLDETLTLVDRDFQGQRVYVERHLLENLVVSGDPGQLRQVFLNLLLNARQAMPSGGRICVVLERAGDRARFSVTDAGAGIPPGIQPRLFEPFFTTKTGEDGNPPGSGLGLAISRDIILRHGGEIGVESEPGKGATFTVTLPLAARPATEEAHG